MNKAEFVSMFAEEVSTCTKKYNKCSITSAIIAEGILKSNYGSKSRAKNANNFFAVETDDEENYFITPGNNDSTKYKVYENMSEAIEDYVKNIKDIEITDALTKIINNHDLTKYDSNDEFIPSSDIKEEVEESPVEEVVKDTTPIKNEEVIISSKNIIDTDNTPSEIDKFIIKKGNDNLLEYPSTFEAAKELCDKHPGYSVCNSKGTILYTSSIPLPSVEIKQNALYNKGRKFQVKAVAIYINPQISTVYRTYTGTLVLYDGVERNNRYRVCKPSDLNNSKGIIGWIDKSNIV